MSTDANADDTSGAMKEDFNPDGSKEPKGEEVEEGGFGLAVPDDGDFDLGTVFILNTSEEAERLRGTYPLAEHAFPKSDSCLFVCGSHASFSDLLGIPEQPVLWGAN